MTFDVCIMSGGAKADEWERCLRGFAAAVKEEDNGQNPITCNVFAAGTCVKQEEWDNWNKLQGAGVTLQALVQIEAGSSAQACRNSLACAGRGDCIVFMDSPFEVQEGFFIKLHERMAEDKTPAFVYRCLPGDAEQGINPATLVMQTADCGTMAVRRGAFTAVGGFDELLPLPSADIDFCWRLQATGGQIVYVPQAVAHRLVACQSGGRQRYIDEVYGALLLAYKYGTAKEKRAANQEYRAAIASPRHFEGVRRVLLRQYMKHFTQGAKIRRWRGRNQGLLRANASPLLWVKQQGRGASSLMAQVQSGPRVSVVIRTCSRPAVLRGALCSLQHQTYKNFEVVIVEDGPPTAQEMVETEFAGLQARYISTGENIGRGRAGNLGLAMAEGEYINFLDDDDYFYPDHLELLAAAANQHLEADLLLGCAMAMEIKIKSEVPFQYEVKKLYPMLFERIDPFTMSQMCQIPIQSAWFKRSLYEKAGGLDETLGGNEDWAMWMRMLAAGKRANPFGVDVRRAGSVFVQPADDVDKKARLDAYKVYNKQFFADTSAQFNVTIADMRRFYDGMIGDMRHLAALGKLEEFLENQAGRDEN